MVSSDKSSLMLLCAVSRNAKWLTGEFVPNPDLKDVAATTSLPPTTESRYSTAHLHQTQYMPQDEHAAGAGGVGAGLKAHSTYNAAQEYGGQQQHQAGHAHAQGDYSTTSYAPQAGANTHYGRYTVGSG